MIYHNTILGLALCGILAAGPVHAFGKKRSNPPKEVADSQAYPTRDVSFGAFLQTPFLLPDGKTKVDMSVVLPTLVLGEMASSQTKLRARSAEPLPGGAETQDRYVLKGGVTAFEANNLTFSVTIGYKPGVGDIGNGTLSGIEGALEFTVGSLEMVFYVVDTQRQEVVAVGRGNALPTGGSLSVSLDFGAIKTGADLVFKSPMAPHFRKAARDAILQMANDPRTNFLMDWQAAVQAVDVAGGKLSFSAGARDDVAVGNVFTVYDNADMRLGEVKVSSTDHERATAVFKDDPGGKLLGAARAGDAVKIFFKESPR